MTKTEHNNYCKRYIKTLEFEVEGLKKVYDTYVAHFEPSGLILYEYTGSAHEAADKVKKCEKYGKKRSKLEKKIDKLRRKKAYYKRLLKLLL